MGLCQEPNTRKNSRQTLGWDMPSEHKLLDLTKVTKMPSKHRDGKPHLHDRDSLLWQLHRMFLEQKPKKKRNNINFYVC